MSVVKTKDLDRMVAEARQRTFVVERLMRAPDGAKKYGFYTKGLQAQMRRHVLDLYLSHASLGDLPVNARFLYYELVMLGVIKKDDKKHERRAGEALTDLRQAGVIPWDAIIDETRRLDENFRPDTLAQYIDGVLAHTSVNFWRGCAKPVIITESRSLGGVLDALAAEYQVKLVPTNGASGSFLHTVVAKSLAPNDKVLYCGDLDYNGVNMEQNHRERLEYLIGGPLAWERLVVTPEQVSMYRLPVEQRYHGSRKLTFPAVETEALGQARIIQIVRHRLEQLMPTDERRKSKLRRDREARQLKRLLENR